MAETTPHVAAGRRGLVLVRVLAAIVVISLLGVGSWRLVRKRAQATEERPTLCKVECGEFVHELTEQGTIESANNAEVRCQVKSNNFNGTTILDILPEGTMVVEGQEVAHLDASALETDRLKQESVVDTSQAELIKARTAVETAKLALNEYRNGTFPQLLAAAKGEVAVAEENLGRAKEYAQYSKRLWQKGYTTRRQLEADEFAIEKAENDLLVAKSKLDVLKNYTYATQIQTLESNIKTAEAKLESQENIHKLESAKLALLKEQIENCTLRAPCAGQVVYANASNSWGDKTAVIEVGATVRERQVVVRLPDRSQMVVKVKVNESKIALVMVGQTAAIRLDAMPDQELQGTVVKLDEYPIPTSKFSSAVKDYETTVCVHNPPPGMRPGLTAQATIRVERLPQAVQVPVQAVFEHDGRHYCVQYAQDGPVAREVRLGSTNDKVVVIREGIEAGQEVVLNAAAYRDQVEVSDLPALPERPRDTLLARTPAAPAQSNGGHAPSPAREGPSPGKALAAGNNSLEKLEQLFRDYDKGSQGRVRLADIPKKVRSHFSKADRNGDGVVDRSELAAVIQHRPVPSASKAEAAIVPAAVPTRSGTKQGHGPV